jgi:hypothetical protein
MSAILAAALPIMTAMESNAPRMASVIGMNLAQAQADDDDETGSHQERGS